MKEITPGMEYLSTRQSAKVLQVSLGTVQKMVELGELIWQAPLNSSYSAEKGLCGKSRPKNASQWVFLDELKIA